MTAGDRHQKIQKPLVSVVPSAYLCYRTESCTLIDSKVVKAVPSRPRLGVLEGHQTWLLVSAVVAAALLVGESHAFRSGGHDTRVEVHRPDTAVGRLQPLVDWCVRLL